MQAKNGELAIVRYDSSEHVCFVIGRDKSQTRVVCWEHNNNGTTMDVGIIPKNRVVRAVVKPKSRHLVLNGEFFKLTIDDVEPATTDNTVEETSPTSNVKLGGCYHSGRTYCLGYRNGCGEEIELDDKLFTGLHGGIEGGARAALKRHPEEFPLRNTPRFIVELKAVRIIDEDTEFKKERNYTVMPTFAYGEDYCEECGEQYCDCLCNIDDDICTSCCNSTENCDCEDAYDYDDLDDENVDQTFHSMNVFARARWLKAQEKSQ
jgi:hypothetical protein